MMKKPASDTRPKVEVRLDETKYPNTIVIKIEILGATPAARNHASQAILMAVESLTN